MGRNSSKTDEKLIHAGVALARKKGLKGFTVREVCSRCRVNLGMFHYYFKTRETFDAAVLKNLYGEMLETISVNVSARRSARENVENLLGAVYAFARKNRTFLSCLAGDAFSGDRQIVGLVTSLLSQHFSILTGQLERAQQEGVLRTRCVRDAVCMLLPQVPMVQVVMGLSERMGKRFPAPLRLAVEKACSEEETLRRIRFMLNAVFEDPK